MTGVALTENGEPPKTSVKKKRKRKTKTPKPKELQGLQQARYLAHNQKAMKDLTMEEADAIEQEHNQERARRGFNYVMAAGQYACLHCSDGLVDCVTQFQEM